LYPLRSDHPPEFIRPAAASDAQEKLISLVNETEMTDGRTYYGKGKAVDEELSIS